MELNAIWEAGPIIQLHVVCAVLAAFLGPVALLRRRKDFWHKTTGYAWMFLMILTAVSSFLIWELRIVGLFSPIHLLSVLALVSMASAIMYIKKGNVIAHKRALWSLYWQAIGIAGLASFLPSRIMNDIFHFADPWFVFGCAAVFFVTSGGLIAWRFKGGLQV